MMRLRCGSCDDDELVTVLGPVAGSATLAVTVLLSAAVMQIHADVNRPTNRQSQPAAAAAAAAAVAAAAGNA